MPPLADHPSHFADRELFRASDLPQPEKPRTWRPSKGFPSRLHLPGAARAADRLRSLARTGSDPCDHLKQAWQRNALELELCEDIATLVAPEHLCGETLTRGSAANARAAQTDLSRNA
jgi:hypothetical protein